jgi:lipopolysaccharide biosynthesis glycosyltransferase
VVVLAADSSFIKQLAVTLVGISRWAHRAHRVFVLHDGYPPELRAQLAELAGDALTLDWLDARSPEFALTYVPAHLTTATLFRLRIGQLLPVEINRAIYLDTDIIVRGPLDDLWDLDLHGHALAAARDAVIPWAANPRGLPWSELGVAPDTPYFNSGVILVDTVRWRDLEVGPRALDLLARHHFEHADQCALNTVFAGDWLQIGPEWNLQAGHLAGDRSLAWIVESTASLTRALENPLIVHFTHGQLGRPWLEGCVHPRRGQWFEDLDLTPWRDWRPPPPATPSRTRLLARGVRRIGRDLRKH